MRIARVNHQRHAHGGEAPARQLRAVGGGRGGQRIAGDQGVVDAGLLENRAVGEHASESTAVATFASPFILDETGLAIFGGQHIANGLLQLQQVVADRLAFGCAHEECLITWLC